MFFLKKKLAILGLFSLFSNKQYIFFNKLMWKIVYPVSGDGIRTHEHLIMSLLLQTLDQGSRHFSYVNITVSSHNFTMEIFFVGSGLRIRSRREGEAACGSVDEALQWKDTHC